jgi:hypothetical protein
MRSVIRTTSNEYLKMFLEDLAGAQSITVTEGMCDSWARMSVNIPSLNMSMFARPVKFIHYEHWTKVKYFVEYYSEYYSELVNPNVFQSFLTVHAVLPTESITRVMYGEHILEYMTALEDRYGKPLL